jgi:hypothetical protein
MVWIAKERPEGAAENLAMFLIENSATTAQLHRSLDLSEFE